MKNDKNKFFKFLRYFFLTFVIVFGFITIVASGGGSGSDSGDSSGGSSAPTITSFSPTSGLVGAAVTITGTNFSTTAASNTVKFNGTAAVVTSSTSTQIVTTVPTGATTGTITVTVSETTATSSTTFTVTAPTIAVSGVAAAGAPIIGYAYLKDSAGTTLGPNAIAADGGFSFDVSELTAPFYLEAEGTVGFNSYKLYSATTTSGTANINPLTNLAVAAATGVNNPADVYNNAMSITQGNLDQAIADIQNLLEPILDAYNANINPITGSYTADHTGLDAVLDLVKVDIDSSSGAVTVTDNTTQTTMASTTTTTISSATLTSVPSTQTLTDIHAIAQMLSNFATTLNKGSSLSASDLDSYFATSYGINNGFDRTQTINNWVAIFSGITNKTINSISNLTIEPTSSDYIIIFNCNFSDGSSSVLDFSNEIIVTYENGSWKFKENGVMLGGWEMVGAYSDRNIDADGNGTIQTGIWFELDDVGDYGIQSVTVTGPGLPESGILMTKESDGTVLDIDAAYRNSQDFWNLYLIDDATISQIPDNAVYTFVYNVNGVAQTQIKMIRKRPYMMSELDDDYFLSQTGVASHSLSAAKIGGTLTFSLVEPTAYQLEWINANFSFHDSTDSNSFESDNSIPLNQTSVSITTSTPSWTPFSAELQLLATDSYGRNISNRWEFQ